MYIDPHVHCVSRTTDDYEAIAAAGVVAVIEPAFWLGQPRTSVGSFKDYFSMLVGFERFRAAQFGVRHYCCIGLNSKEANRPELAEEVLDLMPLYLAKEGVVAVGEIGFDDQTDAEEDALRKQIEMAREVDLPIMIHTPHRDKKRGTTRTMDVLEDHGFRPEKVVIDHNNEETVREVLDRGYWAAFTIYPHTKMGSARLCSIVEQYGSDRVIVDSAADWGVSDPLAVPKTARLMKEKGFDDATIRATTYENALAAYGQSGQMAADDWLNPLPIDQRTLFEGNSVLRGGQEPRIEKLSKPDVIE